MQDNQQLTNDPIRIIDNAFYQSVHQRFVDSETSFLSVTLNGVHYRVYNLYLAEFLTSEEVELYRSTKTISGTDYIKSFVEGYDIGKSQFEQTWPSKVLQGEHADAYINDLHRLCFHEPNQIFGGDGWQAAAQEVPYVINHTAVKWYGFFCGKMTGYDQLAYNYRALFVKLVQCEHLMQTFQKPIYKPHAITLHTVPKVIIDKKIHQQLYNTLKPFVEDTQHVALSALIFDNTISSGPISYGCNQNSLAYVFWQLLDKQCISGTQIAIAEWICTNFTPTTFTTIYDVIKGQKEPAKKSRITIKLNDIDEH